jgi:hypothetical protein
LRIFWTTVRRETLERILPNPKWVGEKLKDFEPGGAGEKVDSHVRRHIPDIAFCEEKAKLIQQFLQSVRELTQLHTQMTGAVIAHDPDFSRFDVLIHMATEKKEEAKYALICHIELHHCEEG